MNGTFLKFNRCVLYVVTMGYSIVVASIALLCFSAIVTVGQEAPFEATGNAASVEVKDLSFGGPFSKFDAAGNRMVENWIAGGNTEVNEHFIRLTPDRAVRKCVLTTTRL